MHFCMRKFTKYEQERELGKDKEGEREIRE